MKKMQVVAIVLVALSFLKAIYFYPLMPDKMATHWDAAGNVNGYMDKGFGLFFVPLLSLALLALFYILPKIDPMRKNYKFFENEYANFIGLIICFVYYVYLLAIAFNLGYRFNIVQFLAPAFAVLFYYIGILLQKARQNWFVGIRTPWTLSSKIVWDRTHKICSRLFKAAGAVALIGLLYPVAGLMASIAVVFAASIFSIVYSYVQFHKKSKKKIKK